MKRSKIQDSSSQESNPEGVVDAHKSSGEKLFLWQLVLGAAGSIFSTLLKARLIKEKLSSILIYFFIATILILTSWVFLMAAAVSWLIALGVEVVFAFLIVAGSNLLIALLFWMLAKRHRRSLSLSAILQHII